ncbi:DUF6498-containing protein [Haloarchaeobius litoreus]|uniref:DUF6498-containing protein n=1 Tax=Haloarchaeobius litoreus TaxID=755306 RepID=A0ABD6DEA9_9EURY|nr:DUF6498-containing protein [Haloarchaeobius litoreus]
MSPTDDHTTRRLELAALVVANALPVVGVLALDWTVSTVLVLYWLETGVVLARGAVAGLFAGRPPATEAGLWAPFEDLADKRGGIDLPAGLPPVSPGNVPAVVGTLWVLLLLWPLGGVGLAVLGPDRLLAAGTAGTVALALVGIVLANAVDLADAVRSGRYTDRPVHAAIPRGRILGLLVLLLAAAAFANPPRDATVSGPPLVFVAVVGAKLLVDLGGLLAATGSVPRLSRLVDRAAESPTPAAVDVPDGEPTDRVRTDATAVRLRGVGLGLVYAVLPPSGLALLAGCFFAWVVAGPPGAVVVGVAVVGGSVLVRVLEQKVLYGHLEYRIYDEGVLAYDRLLDEPQWFVPRHDVVDTRTSDGLLGDRLGYGTGVLRLRRREGADARLVFLSDTERVLSSLGR